MKFVALLFVGAVVLFVFYMQFRPANDGLVATENFPAPEAASTAPEPSATALDAAQNKVATPAAKQNGETEEVATFGLGCFWCGEAIFQQLKGVRKVESGFSGGSVKNPSYADVCGGDTGHAEVIQVVFDPKVISYAELLEVFWRAHDPTTLNRQGNDVGTQYRSVIFTHSDHQKKAAEEYKRKIDEAKVYNKPLVTEIAPFTEFYSAGDYHQNYFLSHPNQPYCRTVIGPKVDKLRKVFRDKLKAE